MIKMLSHDTVVKDLETILLIGVNLPLYILINFHCYAHKNSPVVLCTVINVKKNIQ